jgi:hypothetical protein
MKTLVKNNEEKKQSQQDYKLTFGRIIELLTDPPSSVSSIYIDKRINQRVQVGKERALARASGISKTAINNWKTSGKWVEVSRDMYILLADFLNNIEPALVDPSDPNKTPIRFPDQELLFADTQERIVFPGWKVLQLLNEQNAPPEASVINKAFQDAPLRRRVLQSLSDPSKQGQILQILDEKKGTGLDTLIELIKNHMTALGIPPNIEYAEEYAERLIDEDTKIAQIPAEIARAKRVVLDAGLLQVMNGEMPTGQTFQILFTSLARHLPNREGRTFGSAPVKLLAYCGLPNPYDNRSNSNSTL